MPIYRKSKFTEHIDDVLPSKIQTTPQPPSPKAHPASRAWSPLLPHPQREPSSSPLTTPSPSSRGSDKASSRTASTSSANPSTSLDDYPHSHSPSSQEQEQAPFFIFHSPSHTCSTSLLFESHPVPPVLLTSVLLILSGEGAIEDLRAVERYRSTLPIYSAYSSLDADYDWMDSQSMDMKDLDAWLSNQQAWEGCERVILERERDARMGEKCYAEVLGGVYGFCDDYPSDDTYGARNGTGMSEGREEDRFEYEERHFSDDDDIYGFWMGRD